MIGKRTLGSPLREICTMGSERGDEYKRPCSLGEGTGSKEPDYSAAPQWATASRLVPTHQHRAGLGFSDRSLSGGTAIFSANRRSSTDETTQTQPLTGLQGPSGFGRHQGREDAGAASGAL